MAEEAKLIIVDGSVGLKRTISIKIMNDPALRLVSAVSTTMEAGEKIKFFKPSAIVLGIERVDATNVAAYERFITEAALPMVIVTNESAKLLHLARKTRIEFVARPPMGDTARADIAADEVCQKAKQMLRIAPTMAMPQQRIVPNVQHTMSAPPQVAADGQQPFGVGLNPNMRSVYSIQAGAIVKPQLTHSRYGNQLIAIGSSTGGTEAVFAFLTKLPQDMPPILIVQHMPPVFTKLYADRLNVNCKIEVREAANGDELYPGLALIAPGDRQMCLTRRGGKLAVECVRTDKVSGHCPSVDLLFETVAAAMGDKATGVIMTGMGKDGAQGMLKMHDRGAYTIGQDPESCIVYGMPKAAFDLGAVDIQAPPEKIPELLQKAIDKKVR